MEQLGALGRVDARLSARRPATAGERPAERRRPRRRTGPRRRRRRRAQRLHRQDSTAAGGRLVGLDARVYGRFVPECPASKRRRDNTSHQRDRQTERRHSSESIVMTTTEQTLSCTSLRSSVAYQPPQRAYTLYQYKRTLHIPVMNTFVRQMAVRKPDNMTI